MSCFISKTLAPLKTGGRNESLCTWFVDRFFGRRSCGYCRCQRGADQLESRVIHCWWSRLVVVYRIAMRERQVGVAEQCNGNRPEPPFHIGAYRKNCRKDDGDFLRRHDLRHFELR